MATGGRNFKPYTPTTIHEIIEKREAKKARYAKASIAQRKNWARFRVNGAAGFTEGAIGSAINRLQALRSEIPTGMLRGHAEITKDIDALICISKRVNEHRMMLMTLIDEAEVM